MSMATIGVAGVVVGAGASAYSAYASSQAQRRAAELNSLPYGMQRSQSAALGRAQLEQDRAYANMLLEMGPQFAQQQVAAQTLAANAALGLYPRFAQAERKETTKTRAQDLADLEKYGSGYVGAFAGANPAYRSLLGEVEQGPNASPLLGKLNLEALGAGRSPLGALLESQAIDDLLQGRALSPDEEREAIQSARGAYAARGLNFSNGAIGAEILNRDAYARDREAQRRQFGMGVMGLVGNEDEANRRFELNVEGANTGQRQNWQNFLLGAEQTLSRPLYTELATRAPSSVMSSTLGAMGLGMPVGTTGGMMGGPPSIYQGAQALTPLYNSGADVFNWNANAAESRGIRQQNALGAIGSGLLSAGAQLGAANLANQGQGTAALGYTPTTPAYTSTFQGTGGTSYPYTPSYYRPA